MTEINLREFYPDVYTEDHIILVPDEVAEVLREHKRMEAAYRRRMYYHNAYYSLDYGDDIERNAISRPLSPDEAYEQKITLEQLYAAFAALPDKQAARVYAHYFLGLSVWEIAECEGVKPASVSESLQRGLQNIKKFLKKFFDDP